MISDSLFKLFGAAILCVLLLVILRRESADAALTLRMCAGVALALACIGAMTPIVEYIEEIGEELGADDSVSRSIEVLLKALGVSILTHISATVCRDAGEGSVAYYVELGGKLEMLVLTLPLLKEMLNVALSLLEMS